jgi:competence protein ComEC
VGVCSAVSIAASLWIGLALGRHVAPPWSWGIAVLACGLAWIARRAPPRVGTVALLLAVFGAALVRSGASRATLEIASSRLTPEGRPAWVTARVVDHPARENDATSATLEVVRRSPLLPRGARIRLRLPRDAAAEWGDTLRALARIEPPPGARVPGVPAARALARAQGIVGRGKAVWVECAAERSLARATITRWRRGLEIRFARELSPQAREIVSPLVTGDRSGLDPELSAVFRASGLAHLLALSGMHVVWLASVARGLAAALGAGLAARAWAGAGCALLYVGIAGPLPSLARAAGTELIAALARLRGRPLDPLQALAISILALLAAKPEWADDLGFQLSCAATLGLTTLARRAGDELVGRGGARSRLISAVAPTLAAQVTTLPVLLDRFHALPWTVLGSNLLAVPVCDLLLASAWLGAGLDAIAPGWGRWSFAACEPLARILVAIARTSASAPRAMWATGHSWWPVALALAGAALAVLACLPPRELVGAHATADARAARGWMATLAVTLALLLGMTAPPLAPPPGRWWLVILDVGQGDAIAVAGGDGWRLIDTGPRSPTWDAGASVVVPFLQWAAVRRLDAVCLTHDHGDHTGGAPAVRRALPVAHWWRAAGSFPRAAPRVARAAAAGDTLGRHPLLVARWPRAGFASHDPNAGSLALEVGDGAARALLAADIDSTIECGLDVRAPILALKVAHHGAAASSGSTFLARLRPRVAVVSCGAHNPFGHPDARALARLAACGARVRRTDRDGAVWLEIGAEGVREIDWSRGELEAPRARGDALPALAHAPAHW